MLNTARTKYGANGSANWTEAVSNDARGDESNFPPPPPPLPAFCYCFKSVLIVQIYFVVIVSTGWEGGWGGIVMPSGQLLSSSAIRSAIVGPISLT